MLCSTKNSIEKSIEISISLLNCPAGDGSGRRRVRGAARADGTERDQGGDSIDITLLGQVKCKNLGMLH